jgi:hypothetical protein
MWMAYFQQLVVILMFRWDLLIMRPHHPSLPPQESVSVIVWASSLHFTSLPTSFHKIHFCMFCLRLIRDSSSYESSFVLACYIPARLVVFTLSLIRLRVVSFWVTCVVGYLMTLSLPRLYNVRWQRDWRMMNWRGFVREQLWPDRDCLLSWNLPDGKR